MLKNNNKIKYRNWLEIDAKNFQHNWNIIKKIVGQNVKILQVVKADAYGHGAIEIANLALKNGAFYLGISNIHEGIKLRNFGIKAPILILSPCNESEIKDIIIYNIIPSISDINFVKSLQKYMFKIGLIIKVHIEIDTGMGRNGFMYYEAMNIIEKIVNMPNIQIEGIFSHLACSELKSENYNLRQWFFFKDLLRKIKQRGINIPIKHIANSGSILNFHEFNLNMVRTGIMSFGILPGNIHHLKLNLKPVMTFKSTIILLKNVPNAYYIGYNKTYITRGKTKIAIIPVGYADGYCFRLSNKAEVLIRGQRVPIIGKISMDICTLNVTHIPECNLGDEVVLMGRQGKEYISINELAVKTNTINYELLCMLGKRAPKIFVN